MNRGISLIFFIILTLFLFVSCGTPTIINFTDAISLVSTSDTTNNTISLHFTVDTNEFENITSSDLDSASPSVVFLYSITDNSTTNIYQGTKFKSLFSSKYKGTNYFGYPIYEIDEGNGICEVSLSDLDSSLSGTYSLFPLKRSGISTVADPTYTYSQSESDIDFLNNETYTFTFSVEKSTDYNYKMKVNISVEDESLKDENIYRYKSNEYFYTLNSSDISDSAKDYSFVTNNSSVKGNTTSINFFAAVNFRGNFSNIFWSDLKYVGSITL
ncbi:MAG: hypothetical protein K6G51_02310 [Sphaerochaetaceae bacterium]|nr:hypothetical protein [Sphaerochaetaceae bacterium]